MSDSGLQIPILSLFSGAGGLDLGFRYAGFDPVLAIDHDAAALASHQRNFPNARTKRMDLSSPSLHSLAVLSTRVGIRGVIGGPPCQGFSRGNVRRTISDPRNELVFAFAEIVKKLNRKSRLQFFLLENVTGILEAGQYGRYQKLVSHLAGSGFHVSTHKINAVDHGIPQVRQRVFLVGLNADRFNAPLDPIKQKSPCRRTVRDAIEGLPAPAFFSRNIQPEEIPYHPNHWTSVLRSARFKTKSFNKWRSFRRLEWDEPSPTVAYGNREIHIHPSGTRRLSIFEAMCLQGLPKRFVLTGNFSEQVSQVSNVVPPAIARTFASRILREIRNSEDESQK